MVVKATKTKAWAEALEKNAGRPRCWPARSSTKFVDNEFASLRATMVKSGMI
jgi:putative tricarboxylic transport membrane protein